MSYSPGEQQSGTKTPGEFLFEITDKQSQSAFFFLNVLRKLNKVNLKINLCLPKVNNFLAHLKEIIFLNQGIYLLQSEEYNIMSYK